MFIERFLKSNILKTFVIFLTFVFIQTYVLTDLAYALDSISTGSSSRVVRIVLL